MHGVWLLREPCLCMRKYCIDMKKGIASILFFCLMLLSIVAEAKEVPPHWPWHGVSIDGVNFSPDQLAVIAKKIHINSVQLRLRPRKLAKIKKISPELAWHESLVWGDQMLDMCKKLGIVAIMTVEGFPIDPTVPYIQTSEKFWNNQGDLNEVVRLAKEMSLHYASRGGELVAYQLLSEPTVTQDLYLWKRAIQPKLWPQLAHKIIATIRENDAKRWIAFAPGPWGGVNAYKFMQPLKFKHIIYGAHVYTPHAFTHQGIRQWKTTYSYPGKIAGKFWSKQQLMAAMKPLRDFQNRYDVPVWIGEFSAMRWAKGGEQYIKDLVSIFNDNGWSWTYFSMNGWHGWMPDYNQEYGMATQVAEKPRQVELQRVGFASERWHTLSFIFGDIME